MDSPAGGQGRESSGKEAKLVSGCIIQGMKRRAATYTLARTLTIGGRSAGATVCAPGLLGGEPRPVVGQSLLDLVGGLHLDLLHRPLDSRQARLGVAGGRVSLRLLGIVVLDDALVVLLDDFLRDTLHAEDLDVETLPVREGILNVA